MDLSVVDQTLNLHDPLTLRKRGKGIYCKQQRDGLDDGHIPTPLIYSKVQICPTMTTFSSEFGLWEYSTKTISTKLSMIISNCKAIFHFNVLYSKEYSKL